MHHSPGHLTAGQVMEMVSSCWCVMVEMSGENVHNGEEVKKNVLIVLNE